MKGFITILVLLLVHQSSVAQNKIPDSWQKNMTLTVYHGPGMRPEWSRTILSDTACWYIQYSKGKETHTKFTLTSKELNALLAVLQTNKLDEIKDHVLHVLTHDKGNTSILLEDNGKFFSASESHAMTIEDPYRNQFVDMLSYVSGLLEKKKVAK